MKINEHQRPSMNIYENQHQIMNVDEHQQHSTKIYENQRKSPRDAQAVKTDRQGSNIEQL